MDQFLCDPSTIDLGGKLVSSSAKNLTEETSNDDDDDSTLPSGHKFVDTFRMFYPDLPQVYTCWNTMKGCRATNYGTRIDYILANVDLARIGFTDCVILGDVEGSDHCPVKGSVKWEVVAAAKCPPLCTKNLPEFTGKQQKLSAFFTKSSLTKTQSDSSNELSSSQESNSSLVKSHSDCSNVTSNARRVEEKSPLKRSGSSLSGPGLKKQKSESKKTGSGKQGTLLNFFSKPKSDTKSNTDSTNSNTTGSVKNQERDSVSKAKSEQGQNVSKRNEIDCAESKDGEQGNSDVKSREEKSTLNQSTSWKNLLKGPPPAPLCKGHKEPCLLRTVKKDSFNKGRQFYVCCRPEGHKSDPKARCDHFEWVEKKKKKQ